MVSIKIEYEEFKRAAMALDTEGSTIYTAPHSKPNWTTDST
jgi:hypothetical protein